MKYRLTFHSRVGGADRPSGAFRNRASRADAERARRRNRRCRRSAAFGNASYGFLAAAISTALAALGAGFAVAKVGAAAIGALAEKPELFGRLLIFVGLAEGIAIYGLIVSILILNRLG